MVLGLQSPSNRKHVMDATFHTGRTSRPIVELPTATCDCHVHIFDPQRYPYGRDRTYTPGPATAEDLLAFENTLGVERVVLVQPSGYGTDNRCLVGALKQLGKARARGVAVIDSTHAEAHELRTLHACGVRAIRLNLQVKGEQSMDLARSELVQSIRVAASAGWGLQIYAEANVIGQMGDLLAKAEAPIVLDHFGGIKAKKGERQPGFETLLALLRDRLVYVKLSAPYRASHQADYADLKPFAQAFIEAAPDRVVWASRLAAYGKFNPAQRRSFSNRAISGH